MLRPQRPRIFLMAGEPSGDAIGARLMQALRHEYGAPLHFAGVGGDRMTAAGLCSIFPMADISVMGFAELIPALPRIALRLRQTIIAARATSPDVVIGIDSKAFCLRVLRALAARHAHGPGQPPPVLMQYVAPSAWAFPDAPRRAAGLASFVDELLVLLPFERSLFEAAGVACTFVGHPVIDDKSTLAAAATEAAGRPRDALCLLAGSREHEVHANLPHMLSAADEIAGRANAGRKSEDSSTPADAARIRRLLLPAPPSVRSAVEAYVHARPQRAGLEAEVVDDTERYAAYSQSQLALACCGTVNVELAQARVPQVAVYRSSIITSWVVRHLLKPSTPHATLPNILNHQHAALKRLTECSTAGTIPELPTIPELLFEQCTATAIADAALPLLQCSKRAEAQVEASASVLDTLVSRDAAGQRVPTATAAARAVLRHLPDRTL